MIFYPFDIKRYRNETTHLSLTEHAIYRALIDSYYDAEAPLLADDAILMRRHCVRTQEEREAYQHIISEFFYLDEGHYRHDGCDKVIAAVHAKSLKAKASAEKRWEKENAKAMRTHESSNANGMLYKEKEKEKEQPTSKSTIPPCPVEQIIETYKTEAPRLAQPRIIADVTKANISARWRQDERFRTLDFWKELFAYCNGHDFLSGQVDGRDGKKPFRADLQWIVKAANFAKIINGNYDR